MTAAPAGGGLAEVLAVLAKATPGEWEVLGDNQGHPAGLEWTIEAPELANEDYSGWIAGPHGGDGIATTGNPGDQADAEAIVAAVNYLRSHGAALADVESRLREIARIIEAADQRAMAADEDVLPTLQVMEQAELSRIYALASETPAALSNIEGGK